MIKPQFSQAELKFAAVVGMTLNNAAGILLTDGIIREIMLLAGGISMPLFARFLADGFEYTKDRGKYVFPTGGLGGHFPFCLFVRFFDRRLGMVRNPMDDSFRPSQELP